MPIDITKLEGSGEGQDYSSKRHFSGPRYDVRVEFKIINAKGILK